MFNSLVKGAFGSRDTTRGSPHTLDVRHTMKQRLLLATLLLTSCACVADGWQLECLDLSNAHECAMRYEASVANEFPDLFTRNRASLTITLKDGSKKVINDPTARLNVVRVHAPSHTVIVREQYSEGHAWHILDLESGVSTEIGGFPVFSPDSRLFFAIEPVTESDYNDAVAVVFRKGDDGRAQAVWKADCKSSNWGPTSPKWYSSGHLSFGQVRLLPSGEQKPDGQVHLRLRSGKWQATGLRCRGDA